MDHTVEIKNLDALLQPFFNNKCVRVKQYTTKRLTAAGENYGSLMLEVEIKLKDDANELGKDRALNVVAKMCPPNEWLKKMFNTQTTFKKEIAIYKTIIPTMREFQKEQGVSKIIDCFPECYGACISLNPASNAVDDDAVLLLENLKLSGYEVADRMKGFDLEAAGLLVRDLATFHAVPIAIKMLKPGVFHKNILPYLERLATFDNFSEEMEKLMMITMIETARINQECVPLIPAVTKALDLSLSNLKNRLPPCEPFATINHNDFWVNNTMIKFKDNKPIKNKMVDFQLIDYGSPANDLIFLLFSSVQKAILDAHYDDLVNLYYETFISTLKELKCDPTPFTFELFQKEIDTSAKSTQFFHVMVMLRPIFSLKGTVKELSELSENDMLTDDQLSDEYRQKVPEIILQFHKRGWI